MTTKLFLAGAIAAYLTLIGTTSGVLVGTHYYRTKDNAEAADCTYFTGFRTVERGYWGDVCPMLVGLR